LHEFFRKFHAEQSGLTWMCVYKTFYCAIYCTLRDIFMVNDWNKRHFVHYCA